MECPWSGIWITLSIHREIRRQPTRSWLAKELGNSDDPRGSVTAIVFSEDSLDTGPQQVPSDLLVSSVLIVDDEGLFWLLFFRARNLLSLLSLLFHFSEQVMAIAVPAKRMANGMNIRQAIVEEEVSSVVIGGISSRIVYCVNCSEDKNYDNCDE